MVVFSAKTDGNSLKKAYNCSISRKGMAIPDKPLVSLGNTTLSALVSSYSRLCTRSTEIHGTLLLQCQCYDMGTEHSETLLICHLPFILHSVISDFGFWRLSKSLKLKTPKSKGPKSKGPKSNFHKPKTLKSRTPKSKTPKSKTLILKAPKLKTLKSKTPK